MSDGLQSDRLSVFLVKFMTQYSKSMVIVHWLTLALLAAAWFLGEALSDSTDENSATIA